jgi:hypothetical protein
MADTETWAVFARRQSQNGLARLGTVRVTAGERVENVARSAYGEDWLEMVAIPESGITWAIREESS